jgi:hypothetical protein
MIANEFGAVPTEKSSGYLNGDVTTNGAIQRPSSSGALSSTQQPHTSLPSTGRPPSSASRTGQGSLRFTVANADGPGDDRPTPVRQRTTPEHQASPSAPPPVPSAAITSGATQRSFAGEWPSADEEKRRQQQQALLYQRAKMVRDITQSGVGLEPKVSPSDNVS